MQIMKKITTSASILVYNDVTDLSAEDNSLMQKAIAIRKKAYAPYSKFRVGAAILLSDGVVIEGSNQEDAAYPSGLCAERVAIFYAGASHPNEIILKIAISATSDNFVSTTPIPPCGACRQSISEYEQKQNTPIELYFMGEQGEVYKSDSIADLLPFSFTKDFLQ